MWCHLKYMSPETTHTLYSRKNPNGAAKADTIYRRKIIDHQVGKHFYSTIRDITSIAFSSSSNSFRIITVKQIYRLREPYVLILYAPIKTQCYRMKKYIKKNIKTTNATMTYMWLPLPLFIIFLILLIVPPRPP